MATNTLPQSDSVEDIEKAKKLNLYAYPDEYHLDQLSNASNGIFVCANVVSNMLVERTLEDCPDWCESDYILGGLIDAIGGLSNTLYNFVEREEDKAKARKEDKAKARKAGV